MLIMMVSKLNYLSKLPGIGGSIKNNPEDFLVEEITTNGTVLVIDKLDSLAHFHSASTSESKAAEKKFVHFVLQKTNWTTSAAIAKIAEKLHKSINIFNTAGMKDKISTSTQMASVSGIKKEDIMALNSRIKDIQINEAFYADERVKIGDLLGNQFTIKVRDCTVNDQTVQTNAVEKIFSENKGLFPNYFGEQRFGSSRKNTHLIGKYLVKGDLQKAVEFFLFDVEGEENILAKEARKELEATQNFQAALKNFPSNLRLEKQLIFHLAQKPNDFAGALRALPRNILLLFVHALQSEIFNDLLSERLDEGKVELEKGEYFCQTKNGFPSIDVASEEGIIAGKLIGYETALNEREKDYLEKTDLKKEDFKLTLLPEISSKGTYRPLFSPLVGFDFKSGSDFSTFKFSLPSGCYATMALREFLDKKT